MPDSVSHDLIARNLTAVLDEAFEHHHGIFIDKGTSLFESIDGLSAAEASHAASKGSASIAAHVDHARFYLDVLEAVMRGETVGKVDWQEIWRNTRTVTPEQWNAIRARLRASYGRLRERLADPAAWERDAQFEGALAIAVHTAYHLGAIRQVIRSLR